MNDHPAVVIIGNGFLEGRHFTMSFRNLEEEGAIRLSLEFSHGEISAGNIQAGSLRTITQASSSVTGLAMLGVQIFAVRNIFLTGCDRVLHGHVFCRNHPLLDGLGIDDHKYC